jgi:hypothetical protein
MTEPSIKKKKKKSNSTVCIMMDLDNIMPIEARHGKILCNLTYMWNLPSPEIVNKTVVTVEKG